MSYLDVVSSGLAIGFNDKPYVSMGSTANNTLSLRGCNFATPCRLTGLDYPLHSSDAVSKGWLERYVSGTIRGLVVKDTTSLCSKINVDFEKKPTRYEWIESFTQPTSSPWGYDLMSMPTTNGGLVIPNITIDRNFTILCVFTLQLSTWVPDSSQTLLSFAWRGDMKSLQIKIDNTLATASIVLAETVVFVLPLTLPDGDLNIQINYMADTGRCDVVLFDAGLFLATDVNGISCRTNIETPFGFWGAPTANSELVEFFLAGYPNEENSIFTAGVSHVTFMTDYIDLVESFASYTPWSTAIDGSVPSEGTRVLLTQQNNAIDNGIYVVQRDTLVRAPDMMTGTFAAGDFCFIDGPGQENNQQGWVCNAIQGYDVVGTNALLWTIFTSKGGHIGSVTIASGSITDATGTVSFASDNLSTTGGVYATSHLVGNTLALQSGSIIDSTGTISFSTNDLKTAGKALIGTLTVAPGSITDSTGTISFSTNDLKTTGKALIGTLTVAPGSITDSTGTISFSTNDLKTTGKALIGTLTVAPGSITDSTGTISFSSNDIRTTGNAFISSLTLAPGIVADSTGSISFSSNNLVTSGDIFSSSSIRANTLRLSSGSIFDTTGRISLAQNDLTTSGNLICTASRVGNLELSSGGIVDQSGSISFAGNNLITAGSVTTNTIYTNSIIIADGGSSSGAASMQAGTLSMSSTSISDAGGFISFASNDLSTTGNVMASHFTTLSDERLKDEIQTLRVTVDQLMTLRGCSFRWRSSDAADTGLIAQEVMQLAPEAVIQNPQSGMYSVDYSRLVPYLIEWLKLLSLRQSW